MAMNGDQMGQEIADAIMNTAAPPDVQAQVVGLWQKIAGAIVKHIQNNAEVPPGIAVSTGGATSAAGEVK
jgi:predicted KAP-like P-loop ATPase